MSVTQPSFLCPLDLLFNSRVLIYQAVRQDDYNQDSYILRYFMLSKVNDKSYTRSYLPFIIVSGCSTDEGGKPMQMMCLGLVLVVSCRATTFEILLLINISSIEPIDIVGT